MSSLSDKDNTSFKRYLASCGYVKEYTRKSYMNSELRLMTKLGIKHSKNNIGVRWKRSKDGKIELKNLDIAQKLEISNCFKSSEASARDEDFISSIIESGTLAEPVWGSNGRYLNPADTLLPEWERLKLCRDGVANSLGFAQGFGYDNNLMCIASSSLMFIAYENTFFTKNLVSYGAPSFNKEDMINFSLIDSALLYDNFPLQQMLYFGRIFRDYKIHLVKLCHFYGQEYVAMCCENGYIMMFLVHDFEDYYKDVADGHKYGAKPSMRPKYILRARGSCWSFDIYDDDPNVKYIAAGHNDGDAPTGISLFGYSKGMNKFIIDEIPIEHNVPCVSFIKDSSRDKNIILAYSSIFGSVGTISIQRSLDVEKCVRERLRIAWEYLDEQYLPSWCWSITPVKKSSFRHVGQYEFLSNNYNQNHKTKELSLIYQNSLLLESYPFRPSQTSNLGIATNFVQTMVPVSHLQLLNASEYANKSIKFRFVCAQLPSPGGKRIPYESAYISTSYLEYDPSLWSYFFLLKPEYPLGDEKLSGGVEEAKMVVNNNYSISRLKSTPEWKDELSTFKITEPPQGKYFEAFDLSFSDDDKPIDLSLSEVSLSPCIHGIAEPNTNNSSDFYLYQRFHSSPPRREIKRVWIDRDPIFSIASTIENQNTWTETDELYHQYDDTMDDFSSSDTDGVTSVTLVSESSDSRIEEVIEMSLTNHISKTYRLYASLKQDTRYNLAGPEFESCAPQDYFFVVTTNKSVFLIRSDPLIINAMTTDDIFPTSDISTCHPEIESHNRISIVCYIQELSCIVVASQIGLISILRLTEYNGIYSFRQEYVIGWQRVPPEQRDQICMSQYADYNYDGPDYSCGQCDTVFPYFSIQGMDYIYCPEDPLNGIQEHAVLYILYRDNIIRYRIHT
ncbi:HEL089Wp [Eremothecium sinecaudum]|uniref:HEL089Wp n=1 Tax=Eremothecium sinecaudum TaxID=45286 RepID=A0A0X8HST0_9SACH|nr:HEL089Wp [Eremothecium sinecaudum]AMD21191.1 HEL089Wp [Eremothecium sinecaudum]